MSNVKYISGVSLYNIGLDDDIIYVDTSVNPVTIVLPNIQSAGILSFANKIFTISDFTNNAAINNITILAAGNTVNSGQNTDILSNNGSAFATIVGLNSWQVTTDNPITNGLTYMGTWNAYTNDPTLISSVGIAGQYYIVSVAGTTNLNGTTDWNVGDWAIFVSGTTNAWQKIDNHDTQSYNFIQDEGTPLPQQSTIDFQGAGVTASNASGKTIVNIPSYTGTAGHVIDYAGVPLTQRANLNFTGLGVVVTDNSGTNSTDVNINGFGYGSWYDSLTQSAVVNTPTAMRYNTPDFNNGVTVVNDAFGNPTKITVASASVYNVQFSAQTYRTAGGTTEKLWIWLRINGIDVPYSSTQLTFKNNTEYQVQSWNFFVPLGAGENCQIMWAVTDIRIQLVTIVPTLVPIVPNTPSVILTVTRL